MKLSLDEQPQSRRLLPGEFIFQEGDLGDFAYIVEEGEIEISTTIDGKLLVLNLLGPGSLFGELALIDGRCRSASARATQNTLLTIITPEQIEIRLQSADPILQMLLLTVLRYLRSQTGHSPVTLENSQSKQFLDDGIAKAIDLIRMESELRSAIYDKQLRLCYQPIVNLSTNVITGFEVLLRWDSPTRGYVYPDVFITLAESTSLIVPIGRWVIESAIEALQTIQPTLKTDIFISINIAKRQIEDPEFITWLVKLINQKNISPNNLKLEILERTLLLEDENISREWIYNCRANGFPLVLDDFGTGYSSFEYLNTYNFDALKIDKSFVQHLDENHQSYNICRTIIELAKLLNMTVVAEGIETSIQADILRELGCPFGQGYYFSKPLTLEGAIAFLSDTQN